MGLSAVPVKPLLPPGRRRRARHVFSHDHRRLAWHYLGHLDPERVALINRMIGMMGSPFRCVFGDPTIVLRYAPRYTARVIKFPERRNEIAKLRAEIEEMRKTGSVRAAEAV